MRHANRGGALAGALAGIMLALGGVTATTPASGSTFVPGMVLSRPVVMSGVVEEYNCGYCLPCVMPGWEETKHFDQYDSSYLAPTAIYASGNCHAGPYSGPGCHGACAVASLPKEDIDRLRRVQQELMKNLDSADLASVLAELPGYASLNSELGTVDFLSPCAEGVLEARITLTTEQVEQLADAST